MQISHKNVRGQLVGAGFRYDDGRGGNESDPFDPGVTHQYTCACGAVTEVRFSIEADEIPGSWECSAPGCRKRAMHPTIPDDTKRPGRATVDDRHVPAWPGSWVSEFHLSEVHNRRTDDELEDLLAWARTRVPGASSSAA